jgi:hypothetical protein
MRTLLHALSVILLFCVTISCFALCTRLSAQEKKPVEAVDAIRDLGTSMVVFQSRQQFLRHSSNLLNDIGFGMLKLDDAFKFKQKGEFDETKPLVWYSNSRKPNLFFGTQIVQLPIQRPDILLRRSPMKLDRIEDWSAPQILDKRPFQCQLVLDDLDRQGNFGIVSGDQFGFGLRDELTIRWRDSKPLAPKLRRKTRELINQSGVAMIFRPEVDDFVPSEDFLERLEKDDKHLRDTAELVGQMMTSGEFGILGITYEDRSLDLRAHAQFKENPEPFNELFDAKEIDQSFETTLGLPKTGFIGNLSINISSIRRSAVARLLFHPEFNMVFDGVSDDIGNLVRNFSMLTPEVWDQMSRLRLAAYWANEGAENSSFAVVGVVDPKRPTEFLDELSRFVVLVDSSDSGEVNDLRDAELEKWVADLESTSYQVRQRATTRLALAGDKAEAYLRNVMNDGSPERRYRIQLLLKRLRTDADRAAAMLADNKGTLWNRIRPSFSMKRDVNRDGKVRFHDILLSLDGDVPAETQAQYEKELRAILGTDWHRIRLAQVGDHVVFMLGSSAVLFLQTVENVRDKKSPLREILTAKDRRRETQNQFEVNFAVSRFINLRYFDRPNKQVPVIDNVYSSAGLRVDQTTWEAYLYFPVEELIAIRRSGGIF